MPLCIVLGKIGPGETVSWLDAALQETRVSGQCGAIPRSSAFQGEAFCEMQGTSALRDVCQHLKESESDQAEFQEQVRKGGRFSSTLLAKAFQNFHLETCVSTFPRERGHNFNLGTCCKVLFL